MNNARKFKILKTEKGVSLIITFFIMLIILAVVLSISIILYSEVKVIRNIGNSVASFYAAESGIEKVLYYDRQVLPTMTGGKTAVRGLCSMYMYNLTSNPKACVESGSSIDKSIYCEPASGFTSPVPGDTNPMHGCEYDVCNDCSISFSTIFDNRTYLVTAKVYPSGSSSYFDVKSKGIFGDTQRQIEILISPAQP